MSEKVDFGGLFDSVEKIGPIVRRAAIRRVDVPADVVALVKEARAADSRFTVPLRSAEHFTTLRELFASAGDILGLTVVTVPAVANPEATRPEDKWKKELDLPKATHALVTPADRRGSRKPAGTADKSNGTAQK